MQKPITVAIAEDHVLVREGIAGLIRGFGGFEIVAEASDGQALLNAIEKSKLTPDIAIVDINMGEGMNGFDCAYHLCKKYPAVKILCLTQHDNEFSVIRMIRNGASGYLYKGCRPNELRTALLEIYRNGFYSSELVSGRLFKLLQSKDNDSIIEMTVNEMDLIGYSCNTEMTYADIAAKMGLKERTMENYRVQLYKKLNVNSRAALALFAIKVGLASVNG